MEKFIVEVNIPIWNVEDGKFSYSKVRKYNISFKGIKNKQTSFYIVVNGLITKQKAYLTNYHAAFHYNSLRKDYIKAIISYLKYVDGGKKFFPCKKFVDPSNIKDLRDVKKILTIKSRDLLTEFEFPFELNKLEDLV